MVFAGAKNYQSIVKPISCTIIVPSTIDYNEITMYRGCQILVLATNFIMKQSYKEITKSLPIKVLVSGSKYLKQCFASMLCLLACAPCALVQAQPLIGETPALGPLAQRIIQADIVEGSLSLQQVRAAGMKIFTTPFNRLDGYGDGPMDQSDTTSLGGRPTLLSHGTFLRVNGLDAQTCLECHSIVSAATIPFTMGIGGAAGINGTAMFMPHFIDVEDMATNGFADFDGRLINPLAMFGVGGVQLLGKEMTAKLQRLKLRALRHPGRVIPLRVKGVYFGTIVADVDGNLDTSGIEGIDEDLVVRPFGRKGEFSSVRDFDLGALMFHLGMQPVEVVGEGIDEDEDGIVNEVLVGEVSALEIFATTQETPVQLELGKDERKGFNRFHTVGCAACHRPVMRTHSPYLKYSFPEISTDPDANVFYTVDLRETPSAFPESNGGGINVPMFSDLKRHDMGPGLAESFHGANDRKNREFITAKLWGVADTAPYLHDGRALSLVAAIRLHGGEAQTSRDAFVALKDKAKNQLLKFLMTLRNPSSPNADLLD